MFEASRWSNQMYHTEVLINNYASHKLKVKDINKREYREYIDIKLRHDEQYHEKSFLIPKKTLSGSNLDTQISSNKYA